MRKLFRVSLFLILLSFFVALFLFFAPRIAFFRVGQVDVSSQERDTYYENLVKQFSEEFLHTKVFLFPRESIFLARVGLKRELSHRFPPLTDFSLAIREHTLDIRFRKRKEAFVVCKLQEKSLQEEEQDKEDEEDEGRKEKECYFGDRDGFLFCEAPELSDSLFRTVYVENNLRVGDYFLDQEKLSILLTLISDLEKSTSQHIERILFSYDPIGKIILIIQFDELFDRNLENSVLLFIPFPQSEGEIREDIEKLMVLQHTELFEKEFFQEKKELDYIDFRIPHQIRYKIHTEQEKEEETYGQE